jgi:hypothetical protein
MDATIGTRFLDYLGVGSGFRDFVSGAADLAASVSSVVGWVGAAMKLAQALGIFGPSGPTQLDLMSQKIDAIYSLMKGAAKDYKYEYIQEQRGIVDSAGSQLRDILQKGPSLSDQDRNSLQQTYYQIVRAMDNLAAPEVQHLPFDSTNYEDPSKTPWYYGGAVGHDAQSWLDKSPEVGPGSEDIPPFGQLQNTYRWDYRMFLPPLIHASAAQLAYIVALEPLFRTTGYYRQGLGVVRDQLRTFAANMMNCIQWTRLYDVVNDKYRTPMAYGWPVGAVDICSGASSYNGDWNQGIQYDPNFKPPRDDPLEPPPVANVVDCLQRSSQQRAEDWDTVFLNSGIPHLLTLVAEIDELTRVPEVSETVSIGIRKFGARRETGTAERTVAGSIGCKSRAFTATVYEFPREYVVTATRQPSAAVTNNYPIPYHYYLESYSTAAPTSTSNPPIARVELNELDGVPGTVELQASCFDWEVEEFRFAHPAGPGTPLPSLIKYARAVLDPSSPVQSYPGLVDQKAIADWEQMQWGDDPNMPGTATHRRVSAIHIDYDMQRADGEITIRLRNRPDEGSFERVLLVVEETPGPQGFVSPPIRTVMDVSMIGLEYHLPSAYFQYQHDCLLKTIGILEKVREMAQASQVPIPRWDPWQYSTAGDYLDAIRQTYPELLKEPVTVKGHNSTNGGHLI